MVDQVPQKRVIISLLSLSFLHLAMSAATPSLATIEQNFPGTPHYIVSMIATLSVLVSVPFSLISGRIVGNIAKYRTTVFVALIILFSGGILPYFTANINGILLGRALFGCGQGLLAPIVSSLTLLFFSKEEVQRQLGRNSISSNFGAVVFQMAGGFLCNIHWRMTFLAYLLIIPVFVIVVLLLPEPEKTKSVLEKEQKYNLAVVFNYILLFWYFIQSVYLLLFYVFITEISNIIIQGAYGPASVSASVLSVFTLAGVAGSFAYSRIIKALEEKIISLALLLSAVSYAIIYFGNALWHFFGSAVFLGLGFGMITPAIIYYTGISVPQKYRPAVFSTLSVFGSISSFASAFVFSWLMSQFYVSNSRFSFIVSSVIFMIIALVFISKAVKRFVLSPKQYAEA